MNITINVAGIGSAPTESLIATLITTAVAHTVNTTATRQTTGPDPTTAEPPVVASITF
jgi:hypothetical protein